LLLFCIAAALFSYEKKVARFDFVWRRRGRITAAAVYFTRTAILALPDVADTSIPSASAWAQKRQIELPFTDFESLRQAVVDTLGQEAQYLRNVANFARALRRRSFSAYSPSSQPGAFFIRPALIHTGAPIA